MAVQTCKKQHCHLPKYNSLGDSQDNRKDSRHKCSGCAYVQGLQDALSNQSKRADLSIVDRSQAGTVRHKDAWEAYNLGYEEGIMLNS